MPKAYEWLVERVAVVNLADYLRDHTKAGWEIFQLELLDPGTPAAYHCDSGMMLVVARKLSGRAGVSSEQDKEGPDLSVLTDAELDELERLLVKVDKTRKQRGS